MHNAHDQAPNWRKHLDVDVDVDVDVDAAVDAGLLVVISRLIFPLID